VSHLAKAPVMVVFTREDDMTAGTYRPASKYRIKAALKDGKITGYHLKEASINGNMYGLIPNFFPGGSIDNYQVDVANYQSNITTGAWRAPYTNFLASAEQSFFDEIAETLNVDRAQLHLELLEKAKANKDERMEYSPERMEAVVKKTIEVSNWGKAPKNVDQGISIYYCHNTHVAEVVDLELENGFPSIKKITCVVDCGIVVNPTGAKNQVVGGILDGIGHMMYGELKFIDGVPQSNNFNNYQLIRINQVPPEIDVHFIESNEAPTGLGEPTLPPIGGAIANAIYKATGQRLYKQPYMQSFNPVEATT
ncbi:MAG: xanthine dehydrogenase family protein molybdopterin-binding subunit, partial [Flavobacteriaceae bacterium]|nr:xanthine dehydrogenase family protein molybdopterin-binding subunit [Flavobacteriaceae bacterium]